MILAWRRRLAASLFKKAAAPAVEPSTEENKTEEPTEKDEEEDDDMDKDIEEQLLKLTEQQRKEAKRLGNEQS